MKNYSFILNFPFIFNLIENVVARRIETHLEHNFLNDSYQYAYRRDQLTETSLLKVIEAVDKESMSALMTIYLQLLK